MAVAQVATATQTCTIGTEHTLHDTTVTGRTYVLCLDVGALLIADFLEVRIYDKPLAGSAFLLLDNPTTVAGPGSGQGYQSIPIPVAHGARFTIRQTAGTGRAIPWSVRTLD